MPEGRTYEYIVWRACERFSIIPPGISNEYDNMASWAKAKLLAYEQIREYEDCMESIQ